MSRTQYRITIIAPDVPATIGRDVQEFIEQLVPDGIVEVRRTVVSSPRSRAAGEVCE